MTMLINSSSKLGLLLASCGVIIALLAGSPTEAASGSLIESHNTTHTFYIVEDNLMYRTYSNSTEITTFYIVEDNLMY